MDSKVQTPALLLTSCVTLGKWLHFVPRRSHRQEGADDDTVYLIGLLGLGVVMQGFVFLSAWNSIWHRESAQY